ncbi:MAG: aldo/keto reductase [Burkholderiales bacterium]|nr:aldo/keto reductase [Burkholderiales bacterium]
MSTQHGTKPAHAAGTIRLGDLEVQRMGFGAMRVTGAGVWGPPRDRDAAKALLRRALDLGITFLDTADSYGPRVSEEIIADALHPYPRELVIGTKGGLTRPNRSWHPDGRPEHLRAALDGSLKRLRLERIDLYQFHAPDPRVPFADSVATLAEAQRAGKIRHIGLSNVSVAQLEEAERIVAVVSVQNEYNLDDRSSEDVLAACAQRGIAFIPWYPLGAGAVLRAAKLKRLASRHGATPAQLALTWLLAHSPVTLPIPGTGSVAHLEENVAAAALRLPAEDLAALG